MTLIVKNKDRETLTRDLFIEHINNYKKVILDVGAGDGKGTLRDARLNNETFYVALDSSYDALQSTSKFVDKKPSRGGVDNLLCVYGNIKESFTIFSSFCDEVRVILPWGDLLIGIAETDPIVLEAISSCAKQNGLISIIINAEIWKENLPKHLSNIGEITPEFFNKNNQLFESSSIKILNSYVMEEAEVKSLNTTWAAKLLSSRDKADFVMAKAVRV